MTRLARETESRVPPNPFVKAATEAMFNTEMGESCTATMLVESVQQFEGGAE